MWKCAKCGKQVEDSFEICWNCGTSQDGVTRTDQATFEEIKKEVKADAERYKKFDRMGNKPSPFQIGWDVWWRWHVIVLPASAAFATLIYVLWPKFGSPWDRIGIAGLSFHSLLILICAIFMSTVGVSLFAAPVVVLLQIWIAGLATRWVLVKRHLSFGKTFLLGWSVFWPFALVFYPASFLLASVGGTLTNTLDPSYAWAMANPGLRAMFLAFLISILLAVYTFLTIYIIGRTARRATRLLEKRIN